MLEQLTRLDWKKDQTKIQSIIKEINFGDGVAKGRCSTVLPAFDVYFAAASKLLKAKNPKDKSLDRIKTYRPKSCSGVKARAVLLDDDVLEAEESGA